MRNSITSPARQHLRRSLLNLAVGELAAVAVFLFLYTRAQAEWGAERVGNFTLLALVILCLILVQGSAYWLLKRAIISGRHLRIPPAVWSALFLLNAALLLAYPVAFIITILGENSINSTDVLIGSGMYLFAIAEFVHYFIVKLVRSRDDQAARRADGRRVRRQVNARLMRELTRAERREQKRTSSE